jgi:hypothetical protein
MSVRKPKSITGGCLCGGVRYQIDFSPDHDWEHGVSERILDVVFASTCTAEPSNLNLSSRVTRANAPSAERTAAVSSTTYMSFKPPSWPG